MAGEQTDITAESSGQSWSEGPEDPEDPQLVELSWEVPVCVTLPIEILNPEQAFPSLDRTLEDLGIAQSTVKEQVVWVDSRHTQVRNKLGKLKEKEIMVLEVRVKAQRPGDHGIQEVVYGSEMHTDRAYCRSSVEILPWKQTQLGAGSPVLCSSENDLQPVEVTMALSTEAPPK
ncbi:forkhead box protein P1-like [Scleropages formosus]|uniref:Forkhead box protein P1-like n=1 Tax=Scleropages formosus TaxID=113540 RepID=A0A0P7WGA7_SCLFO|nr:forkhead box protein P1-like [Scleropages formosus]